MPARDDELKLKLALDYLAERTRGSKSGASEFLEKASSTDPALRKLVDAEFARLLDETAKLPPERARDSVTLAIVGATRAMPSGTETAPLSPSDADPGATRAMPPPVAKPAELIERRYREVKLLGEGGHGKVLLVEDTLQDNQLLALKLVKSQHLGTPELLTRFRNEILLLRTLSHRGIPQIFNDGLTVDGDYYYTMDYVEGENLADVIRADAPLDPARVVRLTRQILDVLDYAHGKGAIHRDLKPNNIMVIAPGTPEERIKVLDFGIAKILSREGLLEHAQTMHTEMALGTPHYMAPEQVRNQEVDARTDVYALGIIIYQMCSGRLPFGGTTLLEILTARLDKPPEPLTAKEAPQWIADLVMKLLERDRENRPDTAGVRLALDELTRSQKHLSRQILIVGASVLVVAIVVMVSIWSGAFGKKDDQLSQNDPKKTGTHTESPPNGPNDHPSPSDKSNVTPEKKDSGLELSNDGNHAPKTIDGKDQKDPATSNDGKSDSTKSSTPEDHQTAPQPTPVRVPLHLAVSGVKDGQKIASDQKALVLHIVADRKPDTVQVNAVNVAPNTADGLQFDYTYALDKSSSRSKDITISVQGSASNEGGLSPSTDVQVFHLALSGSLVPSGCSITEGKSEVDDSGWPLWVTQTSTGIQLRLIKASTSDATYIGRCEVSWGEFEKGGSKATKPNFITDSNWKAHPVVNVSFEDAQAFCKANGLRIPTAKDYELAWFGTGSAHKYPWGDDWRAGAAHVKADAASSLSSTAACGSTASDKSSLEILDLVGNVREWYMKDDQTRNSFGGGWESEPDTSTFDSHSRLPPKVKEDLGFRVVLDAKQ